MLSLSAGVRFASDTWAARRSLGVIKGFKAFCCQMELFHELGRYHPDLELPDLAPGLAYIPLLAMPAASTALCGKQCLAVCSSIQ